MTLTKAGDTVTAKVDASDENDIANIEVVQAGDGSATTYSFPETVHSSSTQTAPIT